MDRRRGVKPLSFQTERALAGPSARLIAGVDEAGRGPWAGPVVAAAVVFQAGHAPEGLNDSKLLAPGRREALFEEIATMGAVGVGIVEVEEIDRLNILQATMRAMAMAIEALGAEPDTVLIDGNRRPALRQAAIPVVGGDALCPSIAAASIVAKVTRDRLMERLADAFPDYGWRKNKGYGTQEHAAAISRFGVTPHHRRSFAPIRLALSGVASLAGAPA
jgi:ribonuclease HII